MPKLNDEVTVFSCLVQLMFEKQFTTSSTGGVAVFSFDISVIGEMLARATSPRFALYT